MSDGNDVNRSLSQMELDELYARQIFDAEMASVQGTNYQAAVQEFDAELASMQGTNYQAAPPARTFNPADYQPVDYVYNPADFPDYEIPVETTNQEWTETYRVNRSPRRDTHLAPSTNPHLNVLGGAQPTVSASRKRKPSPVDYESQFMSAYGITPAKKPSPRRPDSSPSSAASSISPVADPFAQQGRTSHFVNPLYQPPSQTQTQTQPQPTSYISTSPVDDDIDFLYAQRRARRSRMASQPPPPPPPATQPPPPPATRMSTSTTPTVSVTSAISTAVSQPDVVPVPAVDVDVPRTFKMFPGHYDVETITDPARMHQVKYGAKVLVVVIFYSVESLECRTFCTTFSKMIENFPSYGIDYHRVRIVGVDVDEAPSLATEAGVTVVPATQLYMDGQLLHTTVGAIYDEVIQMIQRGMGHNRKFQPTGAVPSRSEVRGQRSGCYIDTSHLE